MTHRPLPSHADYLPALLLLAVAAAGATLLIMLLPPRFDAGQLVPVALRVLLMLGCALVLRRRAGQGGAVGRGSSCWKVWPFSRPPGWRSGF